MSMKTESDVEVLLRSLEDSRFEAIVEGNWDRFASYCDPGLTYTHSTAVTDSLDSYLSKLVSGHYDYHWLRHPISKIEIHDDIALIFGTLQGELTAGGARKNLNSRYLAIWIRRGDTWRLLANQPTVIPETAPFTETPVSAEKEARR
jgi:hypothetical protein